MKHFPAILRRPGAALAAGIAAWPVLAYWVVSATGINGCVRAHGVVGFIAAHGAMMRPVPSCPSASLGVPDGQETVMTVLVAAAVFTTVAHLLVAIAGSRVAEWIHRVAEAIGRLIAPILTAASGPPNFRLPALTTPRGSGRVLHVKVPWRRGPPVWRMAAT